MRLESSNLLTFFSSSSVFKTRKIDIEIGRLQRIAEMHQLGGIESTDDITEPMVTAEASSAEGEDFLLVKALENFDAPGPDDLPFARGDIIRVVRKNKDYWRGELNGTTGIFPPRLVRPLPPPLPVHSPSKPKETPLNFGDDFDAF